MLAISHAEFPAMSSLTFARTVLSNWGVTVDEIPTSQKQEADFLATFEGENYLIEEKTKEDDLEFLAERSAELESGAVRLDSLALKPNNALSTIIRKASSQLTSSKDKKHDFRLIWFTATGVQAIGKYEQFIATLYGLSQILELGSTHYKRCYYFGFSEFFPQASTLDGAIASYTDGRMLSAKLCLNSFSPNYSALRTSPITKLFGTAVEDPVKLEAENKAFILDAPLSRRDSQPLLEYLQTKYSTGPLMNFDLGYTTFTTRLDNQP